MGKMAVGEAGWHPDPSGRAHLRYWDGAAWTDAVAAWGETWTDPIEPGPGRPDASLLNERALTVDYGTAGLETPGRWRVTDATGTTRGSIAAEAHEAISRYPGRWLVLDPSDLIVLAVSPVIDGWSPALAVTDWRGRALGTYVNPLTSTRTMVKVGSQVVATADPAADHGVLTVGPLWDADAPVRLADHAGTTIAAVTNLEERSALRRFNGTERSSFAADAARFRLDLIRPAGLPEPLRSLALAFVPVYANRVHEERLNRRPR